MEAIKQRLEEDMRVYGEALEDAKVADFGEAFKKFYSFLSRVVKTYYLKRDPSNIGLEVVKVSELYKAVMHLECGDQAFSARLSSLASQIHEDLGVEYKDPRQDQSVQAKRELDKAKELLDKASQEDFNAETVSFSVGVFEYSMYALLRNERFFDYPEEKSMTYLVSLYDMANGHVPPNLYDASNFFDRMIRMMTYHSPSKEEALQLQLLAKQIYEYAYQVINGGDLNKMEAF